MGIGCHRLLWASGRVGRGQNVQTLVAMVVNLGLCGSAALANVLAKEFWVVDCMRQFMAQKHRKPQLPCTCLAVAQQNSGAKGIKKNKKWSLKILRPALFIVLHQVPRLQNSHILQKLNRIKSKDKWLSEKINNRLYMSVV